MAKNTLKKIAFLGNYLPRQCGIATFTTDLCEAVQKGLPAAECFVVAMNDTADGYAYPELVQFEIPALRRDQYDLAADFLNVMRADVVCVQHEYGIFGGPAGSYLLPLLRQLQIPVVTTLHTVLPEPSPDQRKTMREIGRASDLLVVMSPQAVKFLQAIYEIPESKIRHIHHGIPDLPFVDPNYYKDKFGAEDRHLLLTFGLLSPGKGIEYCIQALPKVVREFPDLLYIVLGATHPHVKRERGEEYRTELQQMVSELGLRKNVTFHNRFVKLEELCEYLGAADVYVSPYLSPAQLTSGTLAYAMGAGKAVISTPYWYAKDMLGAGRGCLVPFRDSKALGNQILDLLRRETERHAIRKRAYKFTRLMVWPNVAKEYLAVLDEAIRERVASPRSVNLEQKRRNRAEPLPQLNANHLTTLSDSVGILQHAKYTVPDRTHGYSTDDQARALVVAVKGAKLRPNVADWDLLTSRYLSYLLNAFDPATHQFDNFMNYERAWTRHVATEDVHARAIWALSHVVAYSEDPGKRQLAIELLEQAIPPTTSFSSPRARAFSALGTRLYLERYSGASGFMRELRRLGDLLLEAFCGNASDDWPWLEDQLTYGNARIPHALIEAGAWLRNDKMIECGLRALDWLDTIQTGAEKGHFAPVGTNGGYPRGGEKAKFDQQPVEAYTMLETCIAAYRATSESRWLESARRYFDWFLGRNDLGLPLYDYATGGCCDGLHPDRVNRNEGAESTIVWLLSLLLMIEIEAENSLATSDLSRKE